MAGAIGNRHFIRYSERADMIRAGNWAKWCECVVDHARRHPSAGPLQVTLIFCDERRRDITETVELVADVTF